MIDPKKIEEWKRLEEEVRRAQDAAWLKRADGPEHAALRQAEAARDAFALASCPALIAEVERLQGEHEHARKIITGAALKLGPYTLSELLAENEAQRALLREVAICPVDGTCHVCGKGYPHKPDCRLAAALK